MQKHRRRRRYRLRPVRATITVAVLILILGVFASVTKSEPRGQEETTEPAPPASEAVTPATRGFSGPVLENSGWDTGDQVSQVEEDSDSCAVRVCGAGNPDRVTVDPDKTYYTADELAAGLYHDLKDLAPLLVEAQDTYGVDAVFLAAVAALESGWGRYQFRPYNLFGFERHDFASYEEGIDYCAAYLSTEYLTPGGRWYEGVGVDDVNIHYNGRDHWAEQVKAIMGQIVARIEGSKAECTE